MSDAEDMLRAENALLRAKLRKVIAWLDRLAHAADRQAETSDRFPSLRDACRADAKNYRVTAADLRRALGEPA